MDEIEVNLADAEKGSNILKSLERLTKDIAEEFKIVDKNIIKVYRPIYEDVFRVEIKVTPNKTIKSLLDEKQVSLSYFIPEEYQKLKERTVKELYKELEKVLT